MISREQAFNIAKQIVPDLEFRGVKISDTLTNSKLFKFLPPDCWYISYAPLPFNNLSCSTGKTIFICINKETGEIKFHNSLL